MPGTGDATWVRSTRRPEPSHAERAKELAKEYRATVENIVDARGVPQVAEFLRGIDEPGARPTRPATRPTSPSSRRSRSSRPSTSRRGWRRSSRWAKETLAEVSVKDRIRDEVAEGMEKRQREFILRQQMDAIRKELGEDGERGRRRGVPDEDRGGRTCRRTSRKEAERELGRLERTSEQSPEYGWIRTYLDWMLDIPWYVQDRGQPRHRRGPRASSTRTTRAWRT